MNRNQNQKNQLRALRLMLAPVWVGFQAFKPGLSPGSEMGEASNLAACMGGRISGTWWPGRKRGRVGNLFDKIGDGAKLVEFNGNENSIVNFKAPKINSPRLVELLPDTCDCAGLSLWNLGRVRVILDTVFPFSSCLNRWASVCVVKRPELDGKKWSRDRYAALLRPGRTRQTTMRLRATSRLVPGADLGPACRISSPRGSCLNRGTVVAGNSRELELKGVSDNRRPLRNSRLITGVEPTRIPQFMPNKLKNTHSLAIGSGAFPAVVLDYPNLLP